MIALKDRRWDLDPIKETELGDPGATNQHEPFRTIADLCQWLGIPKKTIYKWTSDRHTGFPSYKVGKHLRFRFSEVESWLRKYHASESVREFSQEA
jgi:excisionase family DNA binding protein